MTFYGSMNRNMWKIFSLSLSLSLLFHLPDELKMSFCRVVAIMKIIQFLMKISSTASVIVSKKVPTPRKHFRHKGAKAWQELSILTLFFLI